MKGMMSRAAIVLGGMLLLLATSCAFTSSSRSGKHANMSSSVPTTGPIHYVALGDSTGAGVGARDGGYVLRLFNRLQKERAGSTLTNLCVSGATTADLLRDQLDRGTAATPQLITIGIGINDVGHGIPVEQFAANYATLLERLRKDTQAVIVISNLPDMSISPNIPQSLRSQYQQTIQEFNRRIDQLANQHGIVVFDVYTITHEELPNHPEFFSADQFHPSDAGYQLWADEMWPTIAKAIKLP
jgi:lysophospholipase L1-like esterase